MTYLTPLAPSATPPTLPRDPKPHICGNCRNPFLGGRADCPNNTGGSR